MQTVGEFEENDFISSTGTSFVREMWLYLVNALTFCIPSKLVPKSSYRARIAWREKLSLCLIISAISSLLLVYLIWLPRYLCPACKVMSLQEISKKPLYNPHVIIHGKVYDFTDLAKRHSRNSAIPHHIFEYAGKDASDLFPRPIEVDGIDHMRQSKLKSQENGDQAFVPYYHSRQNLNVATGWSKSFDVCHDWSAINESDTRSRARIVVGNEVIDVAALLNDLEERDNLGLIGAALKSITQNENFRNVISAPWGRDKSDLFRYKEAKLHYKLLLKGYVIGVVDYRDSIQCLFSKYLMLGSTGIMILVIVVKFLASLQLGSRAEPEKLKKSVLILIPCYSEDKDTLLRSINSAVDSQFDNGKKVLFLVSDGIVTGKNNQASTPELLKMVLGIGEGSKAFEYQAISSGPESVNMAEIYTGFYQSTIEGDPVAFVLVIKVGAPEELVSKGNRGKRDSQLILLRFLSKVYYKSPMSPLELELYRGFLNDLGLDPAVVEYVLMIDADTEIFSDALHRLLACCVHDSKIVGICGETRIRNEKASWITMIQVYEYFISHHMSKAFESLFGCVTCLPGCFCLYRTKSISSDSPYLIKKELIDDYSVVELNTLHQQNLLSLGEDRYLTTLVLKHFPNLRTKFTADAVCRTIVPESWSVLLSQRRRWINSTVHNLIELLALPNLCGFCILSMRFVVFMDLFSTIILPATFIYMIFLVFKSLEEEVTAQISIYMICLVYGLQAIVLLLKQQWQHVGWMFLYLSSFPLFAFIIPIYSFWNFDDFSWGRTRTLSSINENCEIEFGTETSMYPALPTISLKTWDEHLDDLNTAELPLAAIRHAEDNFEK